jgi:protoporphyrinogen oxidase
MRDQWIYVQDCGLKITRIQIFNNWSPFLVRDPGTVWIGLEYCCTRGDAFWNRTDDEIKRFAEGELLSAGFIERDDILDATVARVPRAYPAYWGSYDQLNRIRAFTDSIDNLFLVGRNGMHRYNNMDHSMLTAMTAVDNIINGVAARENIWQVNTEEEYHEEKNGS